MIATLRQWLVDSIDALIPLAAGVLVLAFPRWFTRRALLDPDRRRVERWIRLSGIALIAVAGVGFALSALRADREPEPMSTASSLDALRAKGLVMHRSQAGVPDATGWITAESTHGGFSVRLPIPFSDFSMDIDDGTPVRRVDAVGCLGSERIKMSATRATYASAEIAAAQFEKLRSDPDLLRVSGAPAQLGGRAVVQTRMGDAHNSAEQRAILGDGAIYTLLIEWPAPQRELAALLLPTFFDSFRLVE